LLEITKVNTHSGYSQLAAATTVKADPYSALERYEEVIASGIVIWSETPEDVVGAH
jgi:hypothetical protein